MELVGGRTVGVEAKLDHRVTDDQIEAEKRAVDDLFLLVLDRVDAVDHADQVRGVITWKEAIDCFPGSRVTMADIDALPPQKVAVERVLRSLTGITGLDAPAWCDRSWHATTAGSAPVDPPPPVVSGSVSWFRRRVGKYGSSEGGFE
ncbi:hypothetical protein GP2_078_00020 [Gordonia paraffinivorans NBRC 108238]|uniref:CBS domain-containing protein n=1 Tax=Gordonia paraffinivorans NBRC 108238 TaxID=1223543 RepID=A0ABQ0IRW5_9ACTN|nr:hypothetical protein [Gordonia paraffinivorans]GAC86310.1 hypothetical protein GP2_078_00020 [Gordonia paraffinivorans NBRC 108238]